MHQCPNPKPDRPRMAQANTRFGNAWRLCTWRSFCIYQREWNLALACTDPSLNMKGNTLNTHKWAPKLVSFNIKPQFPWECGIVRPWRNNTATGVWWTIWQMWRQHLAFLAVLLETSWPTSRWPAISTVKKPNFSWWKFPLPGYELRACWHVFSLTLCQPKCLSWSFWFLQPRIWYYNFRIQRGSSQKGGATVNRKWMKHNGIMPHRPRTRNFIQLVVFVQDLR